MIFTRRAFGAAAVLTLLARSSVARAAGLSEIRRSTWQSYRHRSIPQQELDISCGPAVLSGLLTNYTSLKWSEEEIIQRLISVVPESRQAIAIEQGFSLLDMKLVLKEAGFDLNAAKWVYEDVLLGFNSPSILQLTIPKGGFHYVLWNAKFESYHWVSDPDRGEQWLSSDELFSRWTMIAAWVFKDGSPVPCHSDSVIAEAFAAR